MNEMNTVVYGEKVKVIMEAAEKCYSVDEVIGRRAVSEILNEGLNYYGDASRILQEEGVQAYLKYSKNNNTLSDEDLEKIEDNYIDLIAVMSKELLPDLSEQYGIVEGMSSKEYQAAVLKENADETLMSKEDLESKINYIYNSFNKAAMALEGED